MKPLEVIRIKKIILNKLVTKVGNATWYPYQNIDFRSSIFTMGRVSAHLIIYYPLNTCATTLCVSNRLQNCWFMHIPITWMLTSLVTKPIVASKQNLCQRHQRHNRLIFQWRTNNSSNQISYISQWTTWNHLSHIHSYDTPCKIEDPLWYIRITFLWTS